MTVQMSFPMAVSAILMHHWTRRWVSSFGATRSWKLEMAKLTLGTILTSLVLSGQVAIRPRS